MAEAVYHTYYDAVQHLIDTVAGTDGGDRAERTAKRAVAAAYRRFPTVHDWQYYWKRARIVTRDPYSTGTIAYDHTGGTNEREVTLSGGTVPTWVSRAIMVVSNVAYRVDRRISSSVFTLDEDLNPGADIAAGTSYELYQDAYTLPADFVATPEFRDLDSLWLTRYVSPVQYIQYLRAGQQSSSPFVHTIAADPDKPGRKAVFIFFPPDDAYNLDYFYKRRTLPLRTYEYTTGTVTTSDVTVTLSSGTFDTTRHVGTVLRFSDDASNLLTDLAGSNPYDHERIIRWVDSTTSAEMDAAISGDIGSGVKFRISDHLDVDDGVMYDAFLRLAEYEYCMMLPRQEEIGWRRSVYRQAALEAAEADNVNYPSGSGATYQPRALFRKPTITQD